ncbi:hypothetical protein Angca_009207, partial [Angiostrongylus cantonensis]
MTALSKMPAAFQQLIECARRVLGSQEPCRVRIISNDNVHHCDLIQQFGAGAAVTINENLDDLEFSNNLDVLIVNQALEKELNDNEKLERFVEGALRSIRDGGVCILRQDLSPLGDPKKVAKLTDYLDVFRMEDRGKVTGFSLYAVNLVEDSVHAHQNWQDFIWTLIKTISTKNSEADETFISFRDFLDKTQYTDTGIFAYEWIFGSNFISPGGWNQNLAILKRFGVMTTGQKMLDIGVGIGGGARQAASEFGLHVMGVDLSSNMLSIALDRVHRDKDSRVMLVVPSFATEYDFDPNSFDYVFSRDCIQHIEDTNKLFSTIYRTLKPGGKVLMTMYGVGNGALSVAFKQYVANRRYYLRNRDQIRAIATDVGFTNIVVENITDRLKETVMEEKQRVEENKEDFTAMFSQAEYEALVSGWNAKLQFIADDNHNWNLFMAAKP